eukprot:Pgem_evm1s15509
MIKRILLFTSFTFILLFYGLDVEATRGKHSNYGAEKDKRRESVRQHSEQLHVEQESLN